MEASSTIALAVCPETSDVSLRGSFFLGSNSLACLIRKIPGIKRKDMMMMNAIRTARKGHSLLTAKMKQKTMKKNVTGIRERANVSVPDLYSESA
jgi:hypothetical protein